MPNVEYLPGPLDDDHLTRRRSSRAQSVGQMLMAKGADTSPAPGRGVAIARMLTGAMGGLVDGIQERQAKDDQAQMSRAMLALVGNDNPPAPAAGGAPKAASPRPPSMARTDTPSAGYTGGNLTGDLARYAGAIQSIESSGNYAAMGPVTRTGDRAHGAYQVMGANIPSWTREALGREMSPAEFLRDKAAQDAVFAHRFGGYVDRYGPEGAAQAWFGGPGSVGRGGAARDVLGTSGTGYVGKFNRALGQMADATPYQVDPSQAGQAPNATPYRAQPGTNPADQKALADMPAPGAQPASLDAMGNETGYVIPGQDPRSPAAAPPAPPANDVAALFSPQPMGPAQGFVPPQAPAGDGAPLEMTVRPTGQDAPFDPARFDMAGGGSGMASAPLPPPRPAELNPADIPAEGAMTANLPPPAATPPSRGQQLAAMIDPNSNDGGARAFLAQEAGGRAAAIGGMVAGPGNVPSSFPAQAADGSGKPSAIGSQDPSSGNRGNFPQLGAAAPESRAATVGGLVSGVQPQTPGPFDGLARLFGGGSAAQTGPMSRQQALAYLIQRGDPATARWAIERSDPKYGFHTLPDGTVLRTDERGGTASPIYRAEPKPVVVGEGGALVGQDGKPLYEGRPKDHRTNDERNFEAAKAGGYTGSFNEFLQQRTQREAKEVTITRPDGTKESFMYDPATNTLRTPEQMGAPTYTPPTPTNPYALGGKGTEDERKAAAFSNRMVDAHGITNDLEALGTQGVGAAVSQLPVIGNVLTSADRQRYNQAKSQFITAMLRRESGAAISPEEFNRYDREFFPQPNEKPESVAQKRLARENAIEGFMGGAGAGYRVPENYAAAKSMVDTSKRAWPGLDAPPDLPAEAPAAKSGPPAGWAGSQPGGAPAGARQAADGQTYVPDPNRPGKWLRVVQ